MSFDISKIGKGEWFPFSDSKINLATGVVEWIDPDPESDERVCFKSINPERMREINDKYKGKKINTPVLNTLSKAMEIIVSYELTPEQEKGGRVAFWDEVITDWTIKDKPTREIIPCTAENKYLLITGEMRFLRYANRCLQLLSGITQETKEASEKN